MEIQQSEPLDNDKIVRCLQCGAGVWDYSTPSGKSVALDNARGGPYLVVGPTAYRSETDQGYRSHWDHCRLAASLPSVDVDIDEFLWS